MSSKSADLPMTNFPMTSMQAFKLDLMNSCFFHKNKSMAETQEMLKDDGDFFFQDADGPHVLLSTRVGEKILQFEVPVEYCDRNETVGFCFANQEFATLDRLVLFFSTQGNYIIANGDHLRLIRPIYRGTYAGRFGYGELQKVRDYVQTDMFHPSFVRSLRKTFTKSKVIEEDLERLILLNHKSLLRIRDFFRIDLGAKENPIVVLRYDACSVSLFEKLCNMQEAMSSRKYVTWAYQAGSALNYLMNQDIYHRRLNPRACMLDDADNLKVSDYWTENDTFDFSLFQNFRLLQNNINEAAIMYRDGWRCLPPETLLNNVFDSASQVWTYALLIWQIFSHCQFGNRIAFFSLSDFLGSGANDDDFYMPRHLTRKVANTGMPAVRTRRMAFYKASENFPNAPESFAKLIPMCLVKEPSNRPFFADLLKTVENEYRMLKFSRYLSKLV